MSGLTSQRLPHLILKNSRGTWDLIVQKGEQAPSHWRYPFESLETIVDGEKVKDKFFELRRRHWTPSEEQKGVSYRKGVREYELPTPQYFQMKDKDKFVVLLKGSERMPERWSKKFKTRRRAQEYGLREVWIAEREPTRVAAYPETVVADGQVVENEEKLSEGWASIVVVD